MSKIHPFRAMYFNPDLIKDFAKIIAPPEFHLNTYDELQEFKNACEYNIYNMLEPLYINDSQGSSAKKLKKDIADRKTTKFQVEQKRGKLFDEHIREIAKRYAGWLETGNIFRDETPGFYVYERDLWDEQNCVMRRKRSILALLSLEDPIEGTIRFTYKPDEEEIEQAYRLMKITFSQFSPVVLGYSDPKNSVQTMLKSVLEERPAVFSYDKDGFFHSIRLIHDEGVIDALQKIFNDFKFGVIEGAHTYMAAYQFMQDMKRLEHTGSGTETVGNIFVNLIALDNDECAKFESAIKVVSRDDAESFKLRALNKQTILRLPSAASQRIWRRNIQTDIKSENVDPVADDFELKDDDVESITLDGEQNPFKLKFITPRCEFLDVRYEIDDWELDYDKILSEQQYLAKSSDVRQATMFLPSEKKVLRLSIDNDAALKNILGRRYTDIDTLDISVFWRNFMKRLYIGFDDEKHSMNIWSPEQLKRFLEAEDSDSNVNDTQSIDTKSIQNKKDLRNSPGYLLLADDIADNLEKIGVFMLFGDSDGKQIVSLIEEGAEHLRQVYRLKFPPAIGLITYRMDMSEADELDDEDED